MWFLKRLCRHRLNNQGHRLQEQGEGAPIQHDGHRNVFPGCVVATALPMPADYLCHDPTPPDPRLKPKIAIVASELEHYQFDLDKRLCRAVLQGQSSLVQALLLRGANPWSFAWRVPRVPVKTMAAIACWKGHEQITQALLDQRERSLPKCLRHDFLKLCELQHGEKLEQFLVSYGPSLAHSSFYQGCFTPLHHACTTCNLSAMQTLSKHGASWLARVECTGATPLHLLALRFVCGTFTCDYTGQQTDGVAALEWIWEFHAPLLFVEDASGRTALQYILGRVSLDAQNLCVLRLMTFRQESITGNCKSNTTMLLPVPTPT